MALGAITVDVLMRTAEAIRNSKKFRGELDASGKAARRADVAFRGMGRGLMAAMGPLIGAATAAVSLRAFQQTAEDLDRVAKQSRKLGVTADNLLGLRHAAAQTAGMLDGQFDMALQRMTRRLSEAAQGKGEAKDAIAELGLSAVDLARMSPDKAFLAIADAMGEVSNQGDRVRLAFKFFDSEGVDLANTLAEGSAKLRGFVDESKRLRGSLDDKSLKQVEAFNDAFDKLGKSVGGIGQQIVIDIAPAATAAIDQLTETMQQVKERKRGRVGFQTDKGGRETFTTAQGKRLEVHRGGIGDLLPDASGLGRWWWRWTKDAVTDGRVSQSQLVRAARRGSQEGPAAEDAPGKLQQMQAGRLIGDQFEATTTRVGRTLANAAKFAGRSLRRMRDAELKLVARGTMFSLRGKNPLTGLKSIDREERSREQALYRRGPVGPVDTFNSLIDANSQAGYAALRADQRKHRAGQARQQLEKKRTKAAEKTAATNQELVRRMDMLIRTVRDGVMGVAG